MLKFMKYEIKGSFKYMAVVLITMTLLSTFVFLTADIDNVPRTILLSSLGLFGGSIAILIHFVGSFSKEVYDDRGYLTLTLPISGTSIVLSKLFVTLLWYGLYSVVQFIFAYLILNKYVDILEQPVIVTILNVGKDFMKSPEMMIMLLLIVLEMIVFIMTVYFSIAISKAALGTKKVGKLVAFILFIVINTGFSFLNVFIERVLPFGIDFTPEGFTERSMMMNDVTMSASANSLTINIPSLIFNIVIFILFLFTTGYLLERKIDL